MNRARVVVTASAALLVTALASPAFAQGRCMLTLGAPSCNTSPIKPVFESTGWKTIGLEQITISAADYKKEAAFYAALMGWTLRSDDGTKAVLDTGNWGSVIFKQSAALAAAAPAANGRGPARANVESFGFIIDKWNAKSVEAELKKRGMTPVADNDGKGFESFHVKDPDGFDVQISNGGGLAKGRGAASSAKDIAPAPFESTGWKTVWLDHFSFNVTNYKESVSFYSNLLGWTSTYDEGSQDELMMGDVGNIIIRGGNPLDPNFGKPTGRGGRGGNADAAAAPAAPAARSARVDHISFGIAPWDTDGVKAELEKRKLTATIDTSSRHKDETGKWVPDDIHTADFKSYHTNTPNGYNLQISYVTKDKRTMLSNAVRPRKTDGQ